MLVARLMQSHGGEDGILWHASIVDEIRRVRQGNFRQNKVLPKQETFFAATYQKEHYFPLLIMCRDEREISSLSRPIGHIL